MKLAGIASGDTVTTTRFWSHVEFRANACWLWTGERNSQGYGRFSVAVKRQRRRGLAHRLAYQLVNGPIPAGLLVLHRCDTPLCVNPDHLFVGTYADNVADMQAKGRGNYAVGERASRAKLTPDVVQRIRRLRREGRSLRSIGNLFKIDHKTVHAIATRKTWVHL